MFDWPIWMCTAAGLDPDGSIAAITDSIGPWGPCRAAALAAFLACRCCHFCPPRCGLVEGCCRGNSLRHLLQHGGYAAAAASGGRSLCGETNHHWLDADYLQHLVGDHSPPAAGDGSSHAVGTAPPADAPLPSGGDGFSLPPPAAVAVAVVPAPTGASPPSL